MYCAFVLVLFEIATAVCKNVVVGWLTARLLKRFAPADRRNTAEKAAASDLKTPDSKDVPAWELIHRLNQTIQQRRGDDA
jgi:hypothetical protein